MVFGEARKYCVALVSLDPDVIAGWAADQDSTDASYALLAKSQAVQDLIGERVNMLDEGLNRWETIKR